MEKHQQTVSFEPGQYLRQDGTNEFPERDECLVWQHFLNGDDQSLIYIYNKYADVLYSYGMQITGQRDLIRDCIQELFCDLIDKRDKLSGAQSVKGYLLASLKRRILREVKKKHKYQLEGEGFNFSPSEIPLSMVTDFKEWDPDIIHEKLNLLSVNQREVIYLHFYEGLSYKEIAGILKIKVTSARMLTYRALESLQKHLAPYLSSFYLVFFSLFNGANVWLADVELLIKSYFH